MKWYSKYVGVPFRSLGRTMQGCDCYGLVQLVLKEHYDIVLPDVGGYVNALDTGQTSSVIDVNTPLLSGEKQTEPSEGLVVVLSSLEGLSSHVGLLVTDKLMLHTTKQFGTIIEPITRNKIKNRIKGLYNVNKSYNTNKSI